MNRKMRRSRLTGIILMGLAAIAIWFFILSPNNNKPNQIEKQVTVINSQKANVENEVKKLQQQAAAVSSEQAAVIALSNKLPPDAYYPELYQQIVAAATSVGISDRGLTSVEGDGLLVAAPVSNGSGGATTPAATPATPATAATPGSPSTAPVALTLYQTSVKISATGTKEQLLAFVQSLYTIPRALAIDSVDVSPNGGNGAVSDSYNVTILVRGFAAQALGAPPVNPDASVANPNGAATSSSPTPVPTPTK